MAMHGLRGRLSRAALLVVFAAGCGSSSTPAPADPSYQAMIAPSSRQPAGQLERAILSRLPKLGNTGSVQIQGRTIEAGAVYSAASGHRCRVVRVDADASRLACMVGDAWAFVPDVVDVPESAETPSATATRPGSSSTSAGAELAK